MKFLKKKQPKNNKLKFSLTVHNYYGSEFETKTLRGKPRTHDPIFIVLEEEPYVNWIIQYDDIEMTNSHGLTFSYRIVSVPKNINDEYVLTNNEDLTNILKNLLSDVLDIYIKENQ